MPKKKTKRKPYFGMDVQDAIVRYNALDGQKESTKRNKIYGEEIHKAFDKLAENIINTFKFTYFDYGFTDIKNEVVAFMVINMHKYDHTKGSKAYSYFSVVAKKYLILQNKNKLKPEYYSGRDDNDDFIKEFKKQWKEELKISQNILKKLVKIEEINLSNVDDVSDIIANKIIKQINLNT